jgi:CheY-like chemotaxis protein
MLAMEMTPDDPQRELVLEIRQAAGRAAALTKQLLSFSRRQQLHPQAVDLNEVIHGVENLIARLLGPEHQFLVQLSPDIDGVLADRGQVEQILMNLAANARDAMAEPGRFTLATSRVTMDEQGARAAAMAPGSYVVLTARDTGVGMSAETRARMFEPFFTTKEVGKGTGLGLATVYGIVEQSRGHIRVESAPTQGATFTIYLPSIRAPMTSVSIPAIPARPVLPQANTVLLVDDELAVRSAAAKLLKDSGYEVLEAANGEEALAILRLDPTRVGMMLTDMVMPGLSGRELARIVQTEQPHVAIAIMSGFIRESMLQDPTLRDDIALVEKPFTLFSLTSALREAARATRGE